MTYINCLAALGDETRRKVFENLREGPSTVGKMAERLPVSRPAVSQHLKVLKQAGLVVDEPCGSARIYRIHAPALLALRDWIDSFWDAPLERFKAFAEDRQ